MLRSLPTVILLLLTGMLSIAAWLGPLITPPVLVERHSLSQEDVRQRIEPTLARSDAESLAAIERQLAHLQRFFAEARGRTPAFAETVLGWGSKWRFVIDKVPYTRGDRHAAFLRKAFSEQLFSDAELTQTIEQVGHGYADALLDVENQMLVRLRQDVVGLPAAELPAFQDAAHLQAAYDVALARVQQHVGTSVNQDVASLVMSIVVQEVVTQVAVRLGISAGVLSVGAGSSWATLGIGLVVGVMVDQVISWVWDAWADPKGQLAVDLHRKLVDLEHLLIDGDDKLPGLRSRLNQFAQQRATQRRQAIHALVTGAKR